MSGCRGWENRARRTIDVFGARRAHDERNVQMKRLRARVRLGELRREEGAATAEYAIATMAAVGFAGLLVAILRSDEVRGMLTELVHRALTFAG